MSDSKIPDDDSGPARPMWVPSVDEWAALSWHQRQRFVMARREVVTVRTLIACEKSHVEDLPVVVQDLEGGEARMLQEMVLMRRRKAAELAAVVVDPAEGDRNWNELAVSIGNKAAVRHVW